MDTYSQNQSSFNEQVPIRPANNLVLSIISTVVGLCSPCCVGLIVGIISIVLSTQVNNKYDRGDYAGAQSASKNSKILAFIALGLGVLGLIYYIYLVSTGQFDMMMEEYRRALESA